jgi:hypothetical protein
MRIAREKCETLSPKAEIRRPKEGRSPKSEIARSDHGLGPSLFIRAWNVRFRASDCGLSKLRDSGLGAGFRWKGRGTNNLELRLALALLATPLIAGPAHLHAAGPAAEPSAYLFTSFREPATNGLQFLFSFDGYHWTNVPGVFLKPMVGPSKLMRDPSLLRGPDGTFHLVWTTGWRGDQGFGYAHSQDLVHWSDQKFVAVMEHEPATVNVWAPELFYDEDRQQFIIVWSSTIPGRYPDHLEPHDNNQRAYYTTTGDFNTFAPAKLFFEPGYSVIDGFILKDGGRYVFLHKDNTRPMRNLRVAFADSPLGPWGRISQPFTKQFTEGPCALKLGPDWLIYFDAYRVGAYDAVKTHDFRSFTDVTPQLSFPPGHKHGTALQVDRRILDYLLQAGTLAPSAQPVSKGVTPHH